MAGASAPATLMDIRVTQDGRSVFDRMRRVELSRLAKANGIPIPTGAPKTAIIPLLESSGVDPTSAGDWEVVQVKDENGMTRTERYPVRKVHNTATKNIDYSSIIEKQAAQATENTELKEENDELKARLERLESLMVARKPEQMSMGELKAYAKKQGLKCSPTMKKSEILELLNGEDTP